MQYCMQIVLHYIPNKNETSSMLNFLLCEFWEFSSESSVSFQKLFLFFICSVCNLFFYYSSWWILSTLNVFKVIISPLVWSTGITIHKVSNKSHKTFLHHFAIKHITLHNKIENWNKKRHKLKMTFKLQRWANLTNKETLNHNALIMIKRYKIQRFSF